MGSLKIRPLDRAGDLGWVVTAHGELYRDEFGWDTTFEALVARIVADYAQTHDPAREAAWIAEVDGRRVGCVFCVAADEETAQLRILLVDPGTRGHGVGGRLVDECLAFARRVGYRRMRLWTNHPLTAARRIYLARGFRLIGEDLHHSFGVDLIGQTYELDLHAPTRSRRHDRAHLEGLARQGDRRRLPAALRDRGHRAPVEFTSVTYFSAMDAVRAFAGDTPDRAVVEEAARRVLTRWDDHVVRHEVVVDPRTMISPRGVGKGRSPIVYLMSRRQRGPR